MTSVIVKENDVSLQWSTCKIGDCNAQVFFSDFFSLKFNRICTRIYTHNSLENIESLASRGRQRIPSGTVTLPLETRRKVVIWSSHLLRGGQSTSLTSDLK